MAIALPDLPYDLDALSPHVSAKTLEFHHGKHHAGYVGKLNAAIDGSELDDADLATIVRSAFEAGDTGLFNNAAQSWNHEFLWHSMTPHGGGKPTGDLAAAIVRSFGDIDAFLDTFKNAALGQFGSGWVWLVADGDDIRVTTSSNAETPLTGDATPLLTLDVWEHAYYLDYQNARNRYVDAFLSELVNWEFAARNLHDSTDAEPQAIGARRIAGRPGPLNQTGQSPLIVTRRPLRSAGQ